MIDLHDWWKIVFNYVEYSFIGRHDPWIQWPDPQPSLFFGVRLDSNATALWPSEKDAEIRMKFSVDGIQKGSSVSCQR